MNVAFIHDWLNGMRGGEKCLESLLKLFPNAPVYTLLCESGKISDEIKKSKIHTSWIQKLPFGRLKYRYYLPLFPWAIRSFELRPFRLVISISHCAAKAVKVPEGCLHICYCLTPMRYLWGFYHEYFGKGPYHWLKFLGLERLLGLLRKWDRASAEGVDYFIAISNHVAQRIKNVYGRDSVVIYPPVDVEVFYYSDSEQKENYFLIVSALVPYKNIDLAIEVFNESGTPLKIIGAGTELERLRIKAGPNIQFLGWQRDSDLRQYYARAQALIFPGEEDFGIGPLEAQACGTPVIAFRKGGALETVQEGETGIFFDRQDKLSLRDALEKFKNFAYDRRILRGHALKFRKEIFIERFKKFFIEKGVWTV